MSYKIAIPSYSRATTCVSKTLKTLANMQIKKECITIFVVEDQQEEYKEKCKDYNIVVGVKGIVAQKEFICNYYPENTHIVFIDDDIEQIDTEAQTLDNFITNAFNDCIRHKAFIWGVYPVWNPFFRTNKSVLPSKHLTFIIGAFCGIINRGSDNPRNEIALSGNKEDVEKSILYFLKDGVVLRYNRVGIKTKFFGEGGLGKMQERFETLNQEALRLNEKYPSLTKLKKRKDERMEIVLKKQSLYDTQKVDESEFAVLYEMLENITIPLNSKRMGRSKTFGVHRSIVFGNIKHRFKGITTLSRYTELYPEIYEEIERIGKLICPFKWSSVQLNHNVVCPPHIDNNNRGISTIVSFGEYEGGHLLLQKDDEVLDFDTNCNALLFDGNKTKHWNAPIKGNKYSLVYYL